MDQPAIQALIDAAAAAQQLQHQEALDAANVANQALIDAAVAAQQLQHQTDLAAANNANAAALAAAIAALPPPAAGAAAGAPAATAVTFALTPGLANPGQPWDYAANEGLKIYNYAATKLQKEPYDGGVVELKQLLQLLAARATTYGWMDLLFMISNQATVPSDKNMLKQYGVLTLANVRAHAITNYIGQPNRAAQAAVMCRDCITATMSANIMTQMANKEADFTINGNRDGTCMVFTLISIVVIETRATVSVLHTKLQSLVNLLKEHKSNITKFNLEVSETITALDVMEETCPDLLLSLFNAYQTASDKDFRDHIRQQRSKWLMNEITVLSVSELMSQAEGHYKVAVETGTWAKPSNEEADIIALAASINAKQEEATTKSATGSATAPTNTRAHGEEDE